MRPDLVLYHGGCYDGFTAAWLFHLAFPRATFSGVSYGELPPDVRGREVVIVDFSYPRGVLVEMAAQAKQILVLDHHATAREQLEGLDFCEFDMERSGCQMALDWLMERSILNKPDLEGELLTARTLVSYIADRDLWKMELPATKEVHAYCTSIPMEWEAWRSLAYAVDSELLAVQVIGAGIRRSIDRYCERVAAASWAAEIYGYAALVVNAPYVNASELASYLLASDPLAEVGVAWFHRKDGAFQYSLRSREGGPDVSRIAAAFGGGGHRHAAGFESGNPPWDLCGAWRGGAAGGPG